MLFNQMLIAVDGLSPVSRNEPMSVTVKSPLTLVRELAAYYRRQREYRKLLELPDYLLDDIGIDRTQIVSVMHGAPLRRHPAA